MTDTSAEEIKKQLELEKLRAEIHIINKPFYEKSSFWLSSLAALAAFGAIITGYVTGYFDNQKLLNEIKAAQLESKTERLEIRTKELTEKKYSLLAQVECYELNQIVYQSFLDAISQNSSRKVRMDMDSDSLDEIMKNMKVKGVVEVHENITLIDQALSSFKKFSEKCNEISGADEKSYEKIAETMYVLAISSVPMLESKTTVKGKAIANIGVLKKILKVTDLSSEIYKEDWTVTPYQTWDSRIKPIREIALRKGGFLNQYLSPFYIESEYTNLIKELFWPQGSESQSVKITGEGAGNLSKKLERISIDDGD